MGIAAVASIYPRNHMPAEIVGWATKSHQAPPTSGDNCHNTLALSLQFSKTNIVEMVVLRSSYFYQSN